MAPKPHRPIFKSAEALFVQQSGMQSLKLPPEAAASVLTLKDLQYALNDALKIQSEKIFEKVAEFIGKECKKIREDTLMALQVFSGCTENLDECVEEVKQNNLMLEAKMGEVENKMEKLEDEMMMMQYRDMEFALRIRGLKENPQNLEETLVDALAPILGFQLEDLFGKIDKVFRVNSWITKQRKLPRDVVVYFTKRKIRNEIIQISYNKRLKVANQEVLILKEIPPRILRKRKDFFFLTDELKKQQLRFRWEIPVGIVVNYSGERYCLNTVEKARDFYSNVLKAGLPSSSEEKKGKEEGERQLQEIVSEAVQSLALKDLKIQRMTRAAFRFKE